MSAAAVRAHQRAPAAAILAHAQRHTRPTCGHRTAHVRDRARVCTSPGAERGRCSPAAGLPGAAANSAWPDLAAAQPARGAAAREARPRALLVASGYDGTKICMQYLCRTKRFSRRAAAASAAADAPATACDPPTPPVVRAAAHRYFLPATACDPLGVRGAAAGSTGRARACAPPRSAPRARATTTPRHCRACASPRSAGGAARARAAGGARRRCHELAGRGAAVGRRAAAAAPATRDAARGLSGHGQPRGGGARAARRGVAAARAASGVCSCVRRVAAPTSPRACVLPRRPVRAARHAGSRAPAPARRAWHTHAGRHDTDATRLHAAASAAIRWRAARGSTTPSPRLHAGSGCSPAAGTCACVALGPARGGRSACLVRRRIPTSFTSPSASQRDGGGRGAARSAWRVRAGRTLRARVSSMSSRKARKALWRDKPEPGEPA
jgi:hypothetical protein